MRIPKQSWKVGIKSLNKTRRVNIKLTHGAKALIGSADRDQSYRLGLSIALDGIFYRCFFWRWGLVRHGRCW